MAFTAEQEQILSLFNRNIYSVPRNQRRYVWTRKNWEELYDDLIYSIDIKRNHFIGSFVLHKEERFNGLPVYTIIDGQQRIITLTIILAAVLYWMKVRKLKDDFEGTKPYVVAKDNKGKEYVMVTSQFDLSLKTLIEHIIRNDYGDLKDITLNAFLETIKIGDQNDKNIIAAFRYFVTKILETEDFNKKDNFLIDLRDAVTLVSYISIISDSEEDSYLIFEILNARGTELEDYELLKNFIMRYLMPEKTRDDAKKIWYDLEHDLGKNISKFVKHYATHKCRYKDKSMSEYKIISNTFKHSDKEELLEDLRLKANYYLKIVDPQNNCKRGTAEYKLFSFFKKRRLEQIRPVLLSVIHQHLIGKIDDDQYDQLLNFIYNFYVCYNTIGEESSNKLTNIIFKYSEKIENSYSDSLLIDFVNDLKEKLPARNNFINSFKNLGYSKKPGYYEGGSNKARVQTVLEVLERYLNNGICLENFTIEHVLDDSESKLNGQIGNLLLLEENINNNLSGKGYSQKIKAYRNSNYKTTRKFAERFSNRASFDIEKRTEYLAELFYDKILEFDINLSENSK